MLKPFFRIVAEIFTDLKINRRNSTVMFYTTSQSKIIYIHIEDKIYHNFVETEVHT